MKNTIKRVFTHPGKMLREEFMVPMIYPQRFGDENRRAGFVYP